MQHRSRRGLVVVVVVATLGSGALTSATQAAQTAIRGADQGTRESRGALDFLLTLILANVLGQTLAELQATLATLSTAQIATLLTNASPAQLTKLLSALNAAQLTGALSLLSTAELTTLVATVTPTELTNILATVAPAELTSILGVLTSTQIGDQLMLASPAQRTSLLGALNLSQLTGALNTLSTGELTTLLGTVTPTELTSLVGVLSPVQITRLLGSTSATGNVISGLLGTATALSGGTPSAASVDALLEQLQALLGSGLLPTDAAQLTNLAALLTTAGPLTTTRASNTSLLTSLLSTLNGALAGSPVGVATAPLQGLIDTITGLLGGGTTGGGTTGGGGTTQTPTGTSPGTTAPTATKPGTSTAPAGSRFTAYRATLGTIKLARNRRSAKVKLSCPASATKGCLIQLIAKVSGQRAMPKLALVVMRNDATNVTIKLGASTTRRLLKKGGTLKLTAYTILSSLSPASKSVKVKRRAR